MKINDIETNLEKDIDMRREDDITDITVNQLKGNSTNDITLNKKEINLSQSKYVQIHKNNTQNFDGFTKSKFNKDINIQENNDNTHFLNIKSSRLWIGVFIGIFIFIISFKFIVQGFIYSGYNKLQAIKEESMNLEEVKKAFNNARFDFILADILLKPLLIIQNENITNGYNIVKGGKEITKLGDSLIQFYSELYTFINTKGIENVYVSNLIYNNKEDLIRFEKLLINSLGYYNKIGGLGNGELESRLESNISKIKTLQSYLKYINGNFDTFVNLFGHDREKKYLIVFQNNDEIRPTGGFMGSLGLVTVYRGNIKSIEKSDIYAYEWNINKVYTKKIQAPKGLNKITGTFGLRDANYAPLVEDSSNDIKFFLDKININVDGIIYINQNTIIELLALLGPLQIKGIDEEISSENFSLLISTLVEAKTFKVGSLGTPKQILFDFSNVFIEKLKEKKDYVSYVKVLLTHLKNREIMIYSFIPEENNMLWKLNLNGKLNFNKTLDFSYPVFTSLSGNKSDRYMKRKFKKIVTLHNDCSIDTSIDIFSSHHFTKDNEAELNILFDSYNIKNRDHILNIQGKGENHQFMRVLLPENAIITPKKGLKIVQYDNYKIAEFFIKTRRLETTQYGLKYSLENSECKNYDFKFYKQPGLQSYDMELEMNNSLIESHGLKKDFYYKK
ncbi:DUF4012 domain-containing protein [Candidatus Gracilibacteria bacterium 28_42_T64]|nr:DUF4012 domain-containing protein [Candidatus Gracilibacteria bacterium 28_42_T64]